MTEGRDISYNSAMEDVSDQCEPTAMNAEDPYLSFIPQAQLARLKVFNTVRAAIWFGLQ